MGDFRDEVRAFVAGLVPPGWRGIGGLEGDAYAEFRARVRTALAERGWVAPHWPVEYGGAGLSPAEFVVLVDELSTAGIPFGSDNDAFGIGMLGNTMLRWSKPELLQRFLPRIAAGEYVFAQGFSEPGAGSDLASLALRAEPDGDQWVLNGQKLWSSGAHVANWMFVLARTNSEAAPHKGISLLLVPLDQPGVEVRPIRNITGGTDFNEVFFTGATTESELVVGEVDRGWTVAMTLLGFERGETALHAPIRFRAELDRLVALVRERGLETDPDVRRRVAWCHVQVAQLRCHGLRTAEQLVAGEEPGPRAAAFKLLWSEYHRVVTELALDVLGLDALTPSGRPSPNWYHTDDPGAPNSTASWTSVYLNSRAGTIYAGSSQVQRGIVGELLLGLPKEPKPAR
ncbi:acyl-CoA dehydrogenase family protein [Amycolatopsis sp. FDAARGOS 1241]|uniref:acyl-CoA dehydrogenase family protein n=1 Tax=Amycolatopsis sp. FDAARGOS 1241 TaxID=2778070 RepID=UPI00195195E1|nr:acyl-CoA dehydrogenase family protein [Amycolatopsis sp. FDAARGOS 1241]QRP45676.1 acyl-CoA dehydrogenase family protein [Amycolatopsis sp. FDAARGOS 1241]